MTRRLAVIVATIAAAAAFASAPADASVVAPRGDTNGCIVIRPAELAICLGRL